MIMAPSSLTGFVKDRIALETTVLRNTVCTIQVDLKMITDSIAELVAKLSTRVNDLEQYDRPSFLSIAGMSEQEDEDTDVKVLKLASRLNINFQERDIEVRY